LFRRKAKRKHAGFLPISLRTVAEAIVHSRLALLLLRDLCDPRVKIFVVTTAILSAGVETSA
jgi:hypothetical protein